MKKFRYLLLILLIAIFACVCFVGCGGTGDVGQSGKSSGIPDESDEPITPPVSYGPLTIVFPSESVNLYVGDEYAMALSLKDDYTTVADPVYTFTGEGDAIDVSSSGIITALKQGSAKITVEGMPNGRPEDKTTATITVKVVGDNRLELSAKSLTLYSMPSLRGEAFENTAVVTGKVVNKNGDEQSAGNITWHSEDTGVCEVIGGVLRGVKVGDTKVWAETKVGGETLKSYIQVNVDYPVIEVDDLLLISKEDGAVTVDFVDGGENKVKAVADINVGAWLKVAGGKLDVNAIASGEREYLVCNDMYGYKFTNTIVADKILTTADETYNFLDNASASNTNGKYYVLNADVNFEGRLLIGSHNDFKGTFNGLGHSIYNILNGVKSQGGQWNSLFGGIANCTIKNLALLNVEMVTGCDGVLCDQLNGNAVIDNVFIHIKKGGTTDQAGAICRRVNGTGNVISNSLIWWEGTSAHRYNGLLFGFGTDGAEVSFDNTKVIAEPQAWGYLVGQRTNDGYQVFRTAMNENDADIIRSYAQFTGGNDFDLSALGKYWDTESCEIPVTSHALDALAIDTFIKIYKNVGDVENIFRAYKSSVNASDINSTSVVQNGDEYLAGGVFRISIEKNAGINGLFIGNTEITKADYNYNAQSGEIELSVGALNGIGGKDLPLVIKTNTRNLIYKMDVVDKVLTTSAELEDLIKNATEETTKNKLFALGADIDYGGVTSVGMQGAAFYGDLDGEGHTIYNLSTSSEFSAL
ncbi:MAG: hypothetical protein J5903_01560, partial [Clostridia bacterium]|nr:hypothetical protein [Clostridia bacterium]